MAQAYDPVPLGEQVEQRRKSIAELAAQVSEFLNLDLSFSAQEVTFLNENVGETFAEATPWSVEAVRLVAQTEGILLDPLHTGRAMASLVDQIRQGNIGREETVVFVHTGGTPNIFAFGDELASKRWALWTPGHA